MTKDPAAILVVDDDNDILLAAEVVLKKQFQRVDVLADPNQLTTRLNDHNYDVVLLDMNFQRGATSGREGFQWLGKILEQSPPSKVILMTAYAGVDLAVRAMKDGAADFIIKPWDNAKLLATVSAAWRYSQAAQEVRQLKQTQSVIDNVARNEFRDIIGASPALQNVLRTLEKVAPTDANVLILGENGTGKELIARAIHQRSPRQHQAFIAVDLGAIPESLFESELFGHKKGAFTDAKEDRAGRFELANGGSLFLDEIGNLSPQGQSKLLRVLESRSMTRVGANQSRPLNARLICATNLPLDEQVADLHFRQDLLYRINTVAIKLPSLRDRTDDIELLCDYFAQQFAHKYHKSVRYIEPQAIEKLQQYHWPGNIRELKHTVERAVIMMEGYSLNGDDFVLPKIANKAVASLNLVDLEKEAIAKALIMHKGNISQTAEALGLGRATLYRKMAKYGLGNL
jgi:DNA-binding NtrC family response regulator